MFSNFSFIHSPGIPRAFLFFGRSFLSSSFHSCPTVIGYSVMSSRRNKRRSDFDILRNYVMKTPIEFDLFAEEIHPDSPDRPMWKEVLSLIESGQVRMLVVPRLRHIADDDPQTLTLFLKVIRKYRVALVSLKEKIDSRRDSQNEIIGHFSRSARMTGGAHFLNGAKSKASSTTKSSTTSAFPEQKKIGQS